MQELEPSTFHILRSRDDAASQASEVTDTSVFIIDESLGYLVNYVAKLFSQAHAACLARHGVHLGQWAVLMFLWVQDGQSQKDLSRQVAIDDATMVRTLDRMERDDLVQRVRNEHDRRQINIFLTEKGRALRDTLIPCALAVNEVATQGWTAAEQRQLSALLHRMIVSLEQASPLRQEGR
jgi:DNA-binding MarR family transcriptional regulator